MDVTGGGLESTPPPTTTSSIASASAVASAASDSQGGRPPRYQSDNTVPMPTLYNDSNEAGPTSDGRNTRQPRMGTIEVLLYNMASMLAGVAVGYDVRHSNVSPIHPKLYPKR